MRPTTRYTLTATHPAATQSKEPIRCVTFDTKTRNETVERWTRMGFMDIQTKEESITQ